METYNHFPNAGDDGFFDFANLQYTASTEQEQSVLLQHLLPAGTYQYCVRAVDYDTGVPLSEDIPAGCLSFTVGLSSPPFPVFPTCGQDINDVPFPVFNWLQSDGLAPGAQLIYDFYLVKLGVDDDANFAIQQAVANGAGNPFIVTDLPVPMYDYKSYDPPLEVGEHYVWAAVVRDLGNVMQFENGGISTPCTFGWQIDDGTNDPAADPDSMMCQNDCLMTGLNTQDIIEDPYTALNSNPLFNMGDFEIRMFQLDPVDPAHPNRVSGLGHMNVPLIGFNYKLRLRIRFDSVVLNIDRQAISGQAECIQSGGAPSLIPGYNDPVWDGNDLSGADLWNLDTYIANKWQETKDGANVIQTTYGFETPIGVRTGGISVAITRLRFKPTWATFDAVALVNLNQFDPSLPPTGLGISNLCISKDGPCKEFKLYLPVDMPIDIMNDQLAQKELTLLQGAPDYANTQGTWVSFDSKGVKNIHVEAAFDFPKEKLTHLTNKFAPARATLLMQGDSLSDWLFRTTMTPFRITGMPQFDFYPDTAWFDFSEVSNPPVKLEDSLDYAKFSLGTEWKGFFAKQMRMRFTSPLNENKKSEVMVKDLFIDENGVSVSIYGKNLVSLSEGQVGSFNFSLDSLSILIVDNGFIKGSMSGLVLVNIADRNYSKGVIVVTTQTQRSFIPYTALLTYLSEDTDGDFIPDAPPHFLFDFLMHPLDSFATPIWYATLKLSGNSAIQVSNNLGDGDFHATAMLHGSLGFSGNVAVVGNVNLLGIRFQNWGLMSDAPYFSLQAPVFSFASPQHSVGDFPLNLKDVQFVTDAQGFFGFQFSMDINLADSSMNLPKASTKFSIFGHLMDANGKVSPGFEYARLDEICLDGDLSVLKVKGCIEFFHNHSTFGNGFRGDIDVNFPAMEIGIATTIQFGNVNNMNYWYADALLTLPAGSGIPLFAGLEAYGFGGGAYYHMARQPEFPNLNLTSVAAASTGQPGFTPSGMQYLPSAGTSLGLKAKVYFGMVKRDVFNANVNFEISFDASGGLSHIWLDGAARFVAKEEDIETAAITGQIHVDYDHQNHIFQAVVGANMTFPGLTANSTLEAYFEENAQNGLLWHVRFGRPIDTKWLTMNILNLANIQAYLEAGNFEIDPLPKVPAMFEKYVSIADMENNSGRNNLGGDFGMKVIHGGRATIEVGGDFLMFYGSLKAGVGYDLMLEKLSTGCGGQGSPANMGFNGWYAYGKAYAGIEGEIGLKLKMFGQEGKYSIASVGVAGILDAGFINPSWAKGRVKGNYALFDSLVVGSFHYEFSAGQPCIPNTPDPLADMKIINDISPKTNLLAAEVTTIPAIATNLRMDENKHLYFKQTLNGQDKHRLFRFAARLVKTEVFKNNAVQAPTSYNRQTSADGFGLACQPSMTLDKLTNYTFKYTVNVEECATVSYVAASHSATCSGTWAIAKLNGTDYKEERSVTFKTNSGLDSIPEDLIEYTFPYPLERHFAYKEYNTPKIVMSQGFNPNSYKLGPAGSPITFKARFVPLNSAEPASVVPAQVTTGSKIINFAWPTELKTATYYAVQFVSTWNPTNTGGINGGFTRAQTTALHSYGGNVTAAVRTRQVVQEKLSLPDNSKRLYEFRFRTSRYATLDAKLAAMTAVEAKYNVSSSVPAVSPRDVIVQGGVVLAAPQKITEALRVGLGFPATSTIKPTLRYLPYVWMAGIEKFDEIDIFGYKKTMKSGAIITRAPIVTVENETVKAAHYYIKEQVFKQLYAQNYAKLDYAFNGPFGAYFEYSTSSLTVKPITWSEGQTSPMMEGPTTYMYLPQYMNRTIKYDTHFMGMKAPPQNVNPNMYMVLVPEMYVNQAAYLQFLQHLGASYNTVQTLWNSAFNSGVLTTNLNIPNGGSGGFNIPVGGGN